MPETGEKLDQAMLALPWTCRVRDVLDLLAAGADRPEIVADYPLLEDSDITAALEYAAPRSDHLVSPSVVSAIGDITQY